MVVILTGKFDKRYKGDDRYLSFEEFMEYQEDINIEIFNMANDLKESMRALYEYLELDLVERTKH